MTTDHRPALRAALSALAPALRLRTTAIPQLAEQLFQAVGQDSFGGFVITTGEHVGRDLTDHVENVIRASNPAYFLDASPRPVPDGKRDYSTLTATQRLAAANGDPGPRL